MSLARALAPYARRGARALGDGRERCELCAAPLAAEHSHVVELGSRTLRCACRACSLLFVEPGTAPRRFRTVPTRVLREPGFAITDAEWSALEIPVRLAFVVLESATERWCAFYPSPAGATRSELPLEAWAAVATRSALVRTVEPDVEALLAYDGGVGAGAPLECMLVPIDACFELVGRVRTRWRGMSGADAREDVGECVRALRARSAELGTTVRRGGGA